MEKPENKIVDDGRSSTGRETLTVLAARGTAPLYIAIPLVAEYEVQILAHTGSSPCRALTGGRYTDIIVLKKLDWR